MLIKNRYNISGRVKGSFAYFYPFKNMNLYTTV